MARIRHLAIVSPDPDRPFVEHAAHDPDGNRFDLSIGKRTLEEEQAGRGL